MNEKMLLGAGIRDWESPGRKSVYWAGAYYAVAAACELYGCKKSSIRGILMTARKEAYDNHWATRRAAGAYDLDCDWNRLSPERRAWYSAGAADALTDVLDALPDSVIEHHPGGLKSLQHARRAWIDKNHRLGDAYARKVGLLK